MSDLNDEKLGSHAVSIAQMFLENSRKLATAESCTGGWVAKLMTDIAGSSNWFDRGFVTYSNEAKQEMLGVSESLIVEHGAVSGEVVAAMTEGVLAHSHADLALAVSGIAGPGGGTADKPVGTVWFAWQRRGQPAQTDRQVFAGDRDDVRRAACLHAMQGVLARALHD